MSGKAIAGVGGQAEGGGCGRGPGEATRKEKQSGAWEASGVPVPPSVVPCSLFSMDGDFAPLKDLASLRARYGFLLILDEVGPRRPLPRLASPLLASPRLSPPRSFPVPLTAPLWKAAPLQRSPRFAGCRPTCLFELLSKCRLLALWAMQAHATLVCGQKGGGAAEQMGVEADVDIHVGTLSKAVGSMGGFVACS